MIGLTGHFGFAQRARAVAMGECCHDSRAALDWPHDSTGLTKARPTWSGHRPRTPEHRLARALGLVAGLPAQIGAYRAAQALASKAKRPARRWALPRGQAPVRPPSRAGKTPPVLSEADRRMVGTVTQVATETLLSPEETEAVLTARAESNGQPTEPWEKVRAELGLDG